MDPRPGDRRRAALRLTLTVARPGEVGAGPGPIPRLHAIVTDGVADRPDFEREARALWSRAGEELALHLRLRRAPARRLFELARRHAARAREAGGWCLVNRRIDVALAAGAHGVQLGAGAFPARTARRLLGADAVVGVSAHAPAEARGARRAGANLVLLGTIYPTPSHPRRPGAGPARIAACRDAGPPIVAIGGITPERVAAATGAGAHGVAALRGIWEAESPAAAAGRYLEALGRGGSERA